MRQCRVVYRFKIESSCLYVDSRLSQVGTVSRWSRIGIGSRRSQVGIGSRWTSRVVHRFKIALTHTTHGTFYSAVYSEYMAIGAEHGDL